MCDLLFASLIQNVSMLKKRNFPDGTKSCLSEWKAIKKGCKNENGWTDFSETVSVNLKYNCEEQSHQACGTVIYHITKKIQTINQHFYTEKKRNSTRTKQSRNFQNDSYSNSLSENMSGNFTTNMTNYAKNYLKRIFNYLWNKLCQIM